MLLVGQDLLIVSSSTLIKTPAIIAVIKAANVPPIIARSPINRFTDSIWSNSTNPTYLIPMLAKLPKPAQRIAGNQSRRSDRASG